MGQSSHFLRKTGMAQCVYKKMLSVIVIREMQIKATMRKHLQQLERPLSERQAAYAGSCGEKRSCAHWGWEWRYSHCGKQLGLPPNKNQKQGRWLGGYSAYCTNIRG